MRTSNYSCPGDPPMLEAEGPAWLWGFRRKVNFALAVSWGLPWGSGARACGGGRREGQEEFWEQGPSHSKAWRRKVSAHMWGVWLFVRNPDVEE